MMTRPNVQCKLIVLVKIQEIPCNIIPGKGLGGQKIFKLMIQFILNKMSIIQYTLEYVSNIYWGQGVNIT